MVGMESGSTGSTCTGSGKKPSGSRRSWSVLEEKVLIAAMKEIVAHGWKSDNSFRSGYLIQLEKLIKKTFPNTDLKGTPHILSRVTSWKKYYGSLNAILSRSDVGFISGGNNMIECEDEQWEQIMKVDGNAKLMRFKSWPYYKDWKEIFGEDRATGDAAEDYVDAWKEMADEIPSPLASGFDMSVDETAEHEEDDSAAETTKKIAAGKSKSKKRKGFNEMKIVCDVLEAIGNKCDARLAELVKRIGYETDLGKTHQEAFVKLGDMPCLSVDDKFDVCEILGNQVSQLQIFMGLPDDARFLYVDRLLKKGRK